ncbi:SpoIIE family protein phosphatase [Roseivirga sp. BDSF3-8]|uniref:SpoIIE family protein phosphatase n=1 Tax=Roseivirga sp. BDSF3-8 TaxID=3241598 RepID=UPI003531ACBB
MLQRRYTQFTHSLLIFLLALAAHQASGQYYYFRPVTVADGLPQTQSEVIFEDSRGFLWIGSYEGGLSRYDGYSYKTYTMRDGLVYNSIKDLDETSKGELIVGTGQGVSIFNGQTFTTLLDKVIVSELQVDSQDNIWIVSSSGLIRLRAQNNYSPEYYPPFKGRPLRALYIDSPNKTLWTGGTDSLFQMPLDAPFEPSPVHTGYITPGGNSENVEFQEITMSPEGNLWVALPAYGLYEFRSGTFSPMFEEELKGVQPHKIIYGSDSSLWIPTYQQGIFQYEKGKLYNFHQQNGLSNNHVRDLTVTSEGEVWICTSAGISRFNGKLFTHITEEQGLKNNLVWDLDIIGDRLYITHFDGISYLDNNRLVNLDQNGYSQSGGTDLYVTEEIILAGSRQGLYICEDPEAENPQFRQVPFYTSEPFFQVICSKDKQRIYAVLNGYTLVQFDWDDKEHELSNPGKLVSFPEEINDIREDEYGRIWVAHDLGLSIVHPDSGTFSHILEGQPLNQILPLEPNTFILASSGHGLFFMKVNNVKNPKDHILTSVSKQDGLASDNIYSIILSGDSVLWLGTENGINKLKLPYQKLEQVRHYAGDEGFTAIEANHKAVTTDENGNIWWGTIRGVTKYNPVYAGEASTPPDVLLTRLDLFYREADWTNYADDVSSWFSLPEDLTLPHDQNHLTFHYTAPQLAGSRKVRYAYRLEGLEDEWSPATAKREAVYANIPPGKYRFVVKATLEGTAWNDSPATFSFIIRKPFYTTWWFIGIALGTLGMVAFTYTRRKLRKVEESRDLLARKVKERTAEIEEQKDELEKQNYQITSSISYAKRIQEAILPSQNDLKGELSESFIFYKPRDIVSGDFYWTHRKGDIVYLAVVDCTGHGVPGAFMSMIGYNQLNTAINTNTRPSPVDILEHMDREVMAALRQDDLTQETQDGMDVALVMLDTASKTLTFAGARRPLYLVCDGEMKEIKGSRNSIGGSIESGSKRYEQHTLPYDDGCMMYMSSDGFADQFGGPADRKFMTGRFKKLLTSLAALPVDSQQQNMAQAFEEWIRENEQTDDVLVLGVKLS